MLTSRCRLRLRRVARMSQQSPTLASLFGLSVELLLIFLIVLYITMFIIFFIYPARQRVMEGRAINSISSPGGFRALSPQGPTVKHKYTELALNSHTYSCHTTMVAIQLYLIGIAALVQAGHRGLRTTHDALVVQDSNSTHHGSDPFTPEGTLDALSDKEFTTLRHPAFPIYGVRVIGVMRQ